MKANKFNHKVSNEGNSLPKTQNIKRTKRKKEERVAPKPILTDDFPKSIYFQNDKVTIYDASKIGADRYNGLMGNIPLHQEAAEALAIRINNQEYPGYEWEDIPSWKDAIAVFKNYNNDEVRLALRIPTQKSFTVKRPAYGDSLTTDSLGYALCTSAMTGSWLNIYACNLKGNGLSEVIKTSPFNWITPAQSQEMYMNSKTLADILGKVEVFRILD